MRKPDFWIAYVLLLIAQLLLSNYFHVTPYIMLSILPVMVLCISIRVGTVGTMAIAFVTGLAVDFLSEGVIGLNALALTPVAFLRNPIIRLVFGNEVFARGEDFSLQRSGFGKLTLAILLAQTVFLAIYIWADGAGLRPFWFNAARFAASLATGLALSMCTLQVLAPDTRK